MATYQPPVVEDLGTLAELTQAVSLSGAEDGASKAMPLHHAQPSAPAGP